MGIEIQVLGKPVWRSVDALASRDDPVPLLDLLDAAPEGWIQDALWRHVATVDRLQQQLQRTPVNLPVVQRMVTRMQLAAADPLLDGLETADDRLAPILVDMLAALGDEIGPLVISRIPGARWALQRQLLVVLGRLGTLPSGFGPREFIRHPDSAVRREALRLLMKLKETREQAIAVSLSDPDERIVRLALGASMTNCPKEAATILMGRADDPALSADLRALGIRALSSFTSRETLAFLIDHALGRKRLLRRRALAPKTPEMLAALTGLAAHWRDDPAARPIFELAAASSDAEISDMVARRGSSS
jgi:hypothetical protein